MDQTISDYLSEINQITERSTSIKQDIASSKQRIIDAIGDATFEPQKALSEVAASASGVGNIMLEQALEPYFKKGLSKIKGPLKEGFENFFKTGDTSALKDAIGEAVDEPLSSFKQAISNFDLPDELPDFLERMSDLKPTSSLKAVSDFFSSNKPRTLEEPPTEIELDDMTTIPEPTMDPSELAQPLPNPDEHITEMEQPHDIPMKDLNATEQNPEPETEVTEFNQAKQDIMEPAQAQEDDITAQVQRETGIQNLKESDIMDGEAMDDIAEATETAEGIEAGAEGAAIAETAETGIEDALAPETGGLSLLFGALLTGIGAGVGSLVEKKRREAEERKRAMERQQISEAQQQIGQVQEQAQQQIQHLSRPTFQDI